MQIMQRRDECTWFDVLHEITCGTSFDCRQDIVLIIEKTENHCACFGSESRNLRKQIQATHVWHNEIQQINVGIDVPNQLTALLAIHSRANQ